MKLTVPTASNHSVGVADLIGLLIPCQAPSFASAMQASELTRGAPAEHALLLPVTRQEPTSKPSERKERPRLSRKSQPHGGSRIQSATVQPAIPSRVSLPIVLASVQVQNPADSVAWEEPQITPGTAEATGNSAQLVQLHTQPVGRDVNGLASADSAKNQNILDEPSRDRAEASEPNLGVVPGTEVAVRPDASGQEHFSREVQEASSLPLEGATARDAPLAASAHATARADQISTPATMRAGTSVIAQAGTSVITLRPTAEGNVSAFSAISSSPAVETDPELDAKAHVRTPSPTRTDGTEQQRRLTGAPLDPQSSTVSSGANVPAAAQGDQRQGDASQPHRSSSGAVLKGDTPHVGAHAEGGAPGAGSLNPTFLVPGQRPAAAAPHQTAGAPTGSAFQAKQGMQQTPEGSTARALGSAMRTGSLGIQTELFGRVTIQSSAGAGELSAQLFLENAKHGAILATHLPALEQRIGERFGVNASVQVAAGDQSSAGSTGGDDRGSRQSQPQYQTAASGSRPSPVASADWPQESSGLHAINLVHMHSSSSSRLDVTA